MADSKQCYIGFDLGGTKMRVLVVDTNLKILSVAKKNTKAEKGPDEGIQRICKCMEEALADANRSPENLLGIGFGLPGILDIRKGVILRLINVGWTDVPIADIFSKEYGVPVAIDNDVNAGTYGEFRLGAGKGQDHLVGIFPGTGIGGGIVAGGRIHHGVGGPVAEIGHIVFDPKGPLCNCGARGCYEVYAGRTAIAARAARAAAMGQAPALLAKVGSDITRIRSGVLADSIAEGDRVVEDIVREAAQIIGHLACAMVVTLAPGMIVLGGGLVEAMESIYLTECRKVMDAHPLVGMVRKVKLVAAKLGDDAVALGGACLARDRVQEQAT
jgi:glucokinase